MTTLHQRVADKFSQGLVTAWASEEAMAEVFQRCLRGPVFDRTTHGRAVVRKIFSEAWEPLANGVVPTDYDLRMVVRGLLEGPEGKDYNLMTQVIPNLFSLPLMVDITSLDAKARALESEFSAQTDLPNPFVDKRPKMKVTASSHTAEVFQKYTLGVGIAKTSAIAPAFNFSTISFRITPFGKTPAFSDSCSYGQLPAVGDPYVKLTPLAVELGNRIMFVTWDTPMEPGLTTDSGYQVTAIPSEPAGRNMFHSESGGFMLQQSLASRAAAGNLLHGWRLYGGDFPLWVMPRMSSVMLIGQESLLNRLAEDLPDHMTKQWDSRVKAE